MSARSRPSAKKSGAGRRAVPLRPLALAEVRFDSGFWDERQTVNRRVTLPLVHRRCRDSGRIASFDLGWRPGTVDPPHVFWDSDVAKWVEAASYSLATHPDVGLRRKLDDVVRRIIAAQQPDGYLNVHFTVVRPGQRWSNLRDCHELYCAGHLIEAGVARAECLGEDDLLQAVRRYADLLCRTFGRGHGKRRGYPGHQEVELALVRLWRATGEIRYLALARYFLDERGRRPHYFDREARARGEDPRAWRFGSYEYNQSHLPVREQTEAVGHAVRALYMYAAMADIGALTGDSTLLTACERLFTSVARRRMYVTGGIGSSATNEGFTFDYDLPEAITYTETCASIAFVLFCHRMAQITRDGRYADEMERALYNGVLAGLSQDGERFFYSNPLASHDPAPQRDPSAQIWDGPSRHRQGWFGCACCPPNVTRLLASLGGYVASQDDAGLWIHLYDNATLVGEAAGEPLVLRMKSDYPWDGRVVIEVEAAGSAPTGLHLRFPGWCRRARLQVTGARKRALIRPPRGYLAIRRRWRPGDRIVLELAMPVQRVRARPEVRHCAGSIALQRGPLVYCLESADHDVAPLERIALPRRARITALPRPDVLGGIVAIEAEAVALTGDGFGDGLYAPLPARTRRVGLRAIPYFLWDNRARGSMRVWLRES